MLMGHPPQIITCGRENIPQGCFEGLTPVQMLMVVQKLVAYDAEVQKALADTLEAVQKIAQAGPNAFHRVTMNARAVRVTTSILARTMVDRTMVIVGLREMVDVVFIGEELSPAFHLGDDDRFNRRGAHILQYFQVDLRGWRILVCLVAALHQAQYGGTARRGGSSTAKLNPSLSGLTVAAFDFTGPPFTARTLVALVSFHLVLQLAARIEMVRFVDATIQQIDTTLRCPLLDISGGGNLWGVELQLPQADHQQPFERLQLTLREDRIGPVREHGKLLAQALSAVHTVEALQSVVASFARLDRIAPAAWTLDAIGPAYLSQVISSFLVILQVRDQMFHRVAPVGFEQPIIPILPGRSCHNVLLLLRIDTLWS